MTIIFFKICTLWNNQATFWKFHFHNVELVFKYCHHFKHYTECARKNRWIAQAKKNVLKLHQIKLLLISSNSQVNAVYLWNTTASIWRPWELKQKLRRLLKFLITITVIAGVICWISLRITALLPRHLQENERSSVVQVVFPSMLILLRVLNPPTSQSSSD